jgi:flavin reductase (DIM6/NTAB) family NADH-FMN oxidoreductase RutF
MNVTPFTIGSFTENPFELLDRDWMLVTAGNRDDFNTMTVSWGGLGFIWGKPVFMAVVRHSRYTFEFMEKQAYFTCSAFGEAYRDALTLCGTKSGRDLDKVAAAGLTPVALPGLEAIAFEEARMTLVCRKLFSQDLLEQSFIDQNVFNENYPDRGDIHRLYIGAIEFHHQQ